MITLTEEKKDKTFLNVGIANSQTETVQRFGAAVKEHSVAYKGIDNENGIKLSKGLKDISKNKLNPNDKARNIKQQAGFSAEVKTQARENAEKIIKGDTKIRSTRTDDMLKQSDGKGQTIGGKNEQLYDIAEVDSNGIYVENSGRQLKFVGGDEKSCTDKLLSKEYDKYREADVPLEVPSDFYDGVSQELAEKSEKLKRQIDNAEQKGNYELAEKHRTQLEKVEKTKANLRKGKLTKNEAIQARTHPILSTAKDIHKISNKAGFEGAKTSAIIGGGVSVVQNIVSVVKGDKSAEEAVLDTALDTGKAAAMGYATNYMGSAVAGIMKNASSKTLQSISKGGLPSTIAVSILEVGKTLTKYGNGEIDGVQCLTELGEKGTGMLASSAGAAIGQAVIPIPVVGGLVGGMVGYAMSTAYYNSLVTVLNEAKIAHEERIRIEAECEASIAAMREYRLQIELLVNNYMREYVTVFSNALSDMGNAYYERDTDAFIKATNKITKQLGGTVLFNSKEEFDQLMNSTEAIEF